MIIWNIFQRQSLEHFRIMALLELMSVMGLSEERGLFNKVWHLKRARWQLLCWWGEGGGDDTPNKDSWTAAAADEEEQANHDNAYFCFVSSVPPLISENRTSGATFREVNQAAPSATARPLSCAYLAPRSSYLLSFSFPLSRRSLITTYQCDWCI